MEKALVQQKTYLDENNKVRDIDISIIEDKEPRFYLKIFNCDKFNKDVVMGKNVKQIQKLPYLLRIIYEMGRQNKDINFDQIFITKEYKKEPCKNCERCKCQ